MTSVGPLHFWRRAVATSVAHLADVRGVNPRRTVCGGELALGPTRDAVKGMDRPLMMATLRAGLRRGHVTLCPACLEQEPSL